MRSSGDHVCGLYYVIGPQAQRTYLPQVRLASHTTINPLCFTTKLTQTFRNPNQDTLPEVRYTFPLYDGVAVNSYTINYASTILRGKVQQKDDAKATYQAAVDQGKKAGLLESLPAGVFGVTLGNVPGNTDVVVDITYCGELKHDAAIDGLRYNLPTNIAPRYGSYPGNVLSSNTVANGGISITVDVDMAGSPIRKIQSPSHPIAVSMGATSTAEEGDAPFSPSQASATLTLGSTEFDGDFVLQFLVDGMNKPQAILETHPTIPNQRALVATLVPRFTLDPTYPEIVFIADQSGSMAGAKNESLKLALTVFLKSLPLGVRFNICAFGSTFRTLWPKSQPYSQDNLNLAMDFVKSFTASYGGTEIVEPIKNVFKQRLTDLQLEVMLLTDGQIWGEDAVFGYINEQIRDKGVDARIFTLGIGEEVSHTLVEGVARAGNGFSQFVTLKEQTDQKVLRMLKGALFAHTKDYELEVYYGDPHNDEMTDDDDFEIVEKVNECLMIEEKSNESAPERRTSPRLAKTTSFFDESVNVDQANNKSGPVERYAHLPTLETPKIVQAPNSIPPLFPFNRTYVYLLLGPDTAQKPITGVTLRATGPQGPLELTIPVHESSFTGDTSIHQLAARKAIQDLEEGRGWIHNATTADGQSVKKKWPSRMDELAERECVRLGEIFQVAAKHTSFVAVEDGAESKDPATEKHPATVQVDNAFAASSSSRYVAPSPFAQQPNGALFSASSPALWSCAPTSPFSSHGTEPMYSPLSPFAQADSTAMGSAAFGNALVFEDMNDAACMPLPEEDSLDEEVETGCELTHGNHSTMPAPQRSQVSAKRYRRLLATDPQPNKRMAPRKQLASKAARKAAPSSAEAFKLVSTDEETDTGINQLIQKMRALIALQTFSGAWAWGPELFHALELDQDTVNEREVGGSTPVGATVLAVAFLESKLLSQKSTWEMVVDKARNWLGAQPELQGMDLEAVLGKAALYF